VPSSHVGDIIAALPGGGGAAKLPGRLCASCAKTLDVPAVGMSVLTDTGQTVIAAATDDLAVAMETLQVTLGEGPCVDAVRDGRPVLLPDLARSGAERWPGLGRELLAAGVAASFAFPLQVGRIRLGALAIYQERAGDLDDVRLAAALAHADAATAVLLILHDRQPAGHGYPEPFDPVRDRPEIHQATGMISVQAGVGLAEALLLLRAHAYAAGRPLPEVAGDVVARRRKFGPDGHHE
jgi:hypothetical protein